MKQVQKTKQNACMKEYRKKKKVDESRKGKFNKNNPSLECEVEEQSSTSSNSQNSECEVEKQSSTSNNNKITECDVEKQTDGSMSEYKKEKMAHKISAKPSAMLTRENMFIIFLLEITATGN